LKQFERYIFINKDIRFGKPCIKNTRIAVADVLNWLASGMTFNEIIEDFPQISREHILAALAFSAKREEAIKTVVYAQTTN